MRARSMLRRHPSKRQLEWPVRPATTSLPQELTAAAARSLPR